MLYVILCGVFVCVYVWCRWGNTRPRPAVLPGKLPIIGHALYLLQIKDDIYRFMHDVGEHCNSNNGMSTVYLGPKPLYCTSNAEDATIVLTQCVEKVFLYKLIHPAFGDTFFAATGDVWKVNRKIFDVAFKQRTLHEYLRVFTAQARELVRVLRGRAGAMQGRADGPDLSSLVTHSVLDTVFITSFGIKLDDDFLDKDKYIEAAHKIFEVLVERVQRSWLLSELIFNMSTLKKELDESINVLNEVSEKIVKIKKAEHLQNFKNGSTESSDGSSTLQILLEQTMTEKESKFTDKELIGICNNLSIAGFDTTSHEMMCTLVCIGSCQDVQDKILEEIETVVGDEELTKEHLSKLVYLEAAIKEALRLFPIGPVIGRQATTDVQLSNVTLPAGSSIVVHLWAINRSPRYWGEDAECYRPGRWLQDGLMQHNAFASFSYGKRNCIGKLYAMMYMKTTIIPIIRMFRIEGDYKKMTFNCNVMLTPKSGHDLKLTLRK